MHSASVQRGKRNEEQQAFQWPEIPWGDNARIAGPSAKKTEPTPEAEAEQPANVLSKEQMQVVNQYVKEKVAQELKRLQAEQPPPPPEQTRQEERFASPGGGEGGGPAAGDAPPPPAPYAGSPPPYPTAAAPGLPMYPSMAAWSAPPPQHRDMIQQRLDNDVLGILTMARAEMLSYSGRGTYYISFTNRYLPMAHHLAMQQFVQEHGYRITVRYLPSEQSFSHRYDRWQVMPRPGGRFGFAAVP